MMRRQTPSPVHRRINVLLLLDVAGGRNSEESGGDWAGLPAVG